MSETLDFTLTFKSPLQEDLKEQGNTILAHLRTWFEGNEDRYFGNLNGNKFQVWRFTRGAQGFHPVIFGEVLPNKQGKLTISLRPILNPLGVLQAIIGTIGITFLAIYVMPNGISSVIAFLIAFGMVFTLVSLVYFVYRYEAKYHLTQLRERISNNLRS